MNRFSRSIIAVFAACLLALLPCATSAQMLLLGAGKPHASAGVTPATFVGFNAAHIATGGATISFSSLSISPAVGDQVWATVTEGTGSNSGTVQGTGAVSYPRVSAATQFTGGQFVGLFCHILTSSGDISGGIIVNTAYSDNVIGITVLRGTGACPGAGGVLDTQTGTDITLTTGSVSASGTSGGLFYFSIEFQDGVTPNALGPGSPTVLSTTSVGARPWSSIAYPGAVFSGYPAATANTLGGYNAAGTQKILWTATS